MSDLSFLIENYIAYKKTSIFRSNPRVSTIIPAKSIAAGGVQIDVKGEGFALLQRPRMVLINDRSVFLLFY